MSPRLSWIDRMPSKTPNFFILGPMQWSREGRRNYVTHVGTSFQALFGSQVLLEETRGAQHPHCLLCGAGNAFGPRVDFRFMGEGKVHASFMCLRPHQSYPGILHGGLISAMLDAAMTNCLFSIGVAAMTGELVVRFLSPVRVECEAEITATMDRSAVPMYHVSAELSQDGKVCARATGKFMDRRWTTASDQGESPGSDTRPEAGLAG